MSVVKVAINGYGRIGRNILRALYDRNLQNKIKIVAINDLGSVETNVHLTTYDSTHGKFTHQVIAAGDHMMVDNDKIAIFAERDPSKLPWKDLGIDIVFECTGLFTKREKAEQHLKAGARRVLISAPAGKDVDATIVYGVNHKILKASDKIISNGSCTTNCLAPLVWPLHQELGIKSGLMTTIHSYTNDQVLADVYHTDLRRARSATQSMIPTHTGAAAAIGLVLPELNNKLDGFAMRVPTINVSIVDLTFIAKRETTVEEVNNILINYSKHADLAKVVEVNEQPLVSRDFNHNPASSIYDLTQTKVIGDLVKVLSWYDNEWGFSNRMLDTAQAMFEA